MNLENLRINLIFTFIILFSAAIISRLVFIQVLDQDFYKALAEGLHIFPNESQEKRGEIFFKNGEYLAINRDWPLVFASPPEITDLEKTAQTLSEILKLDKNSVLEKLQKDTLYVLIKNKLTDEEVSRLENLNLAGIYPSKERGRDYPQENLFSQTIGFLDANGQGQYGLEEYYDEILRGASEGEDLILTVDYDIQFMAEKLLEKAKENLDIEEGQIIVMEPDSGKIIALANFPNFNPNQYDEYATRGNLEIFKNGVTQKIFEPGSVFKPITFAAALEEEKITPQTTYIDEGMVEIGGWPIYNYNGRVYGEQTMTGVLEKSINTGAVFVERQIGHNIFSDYITKFGIFERTGVDLWGEALPPNEEFKQGREINFVTASYGQGIEMTPIQLARAYCVIANGGKLVRPYLVESSETTEIESEQHQIISQKTTSQLAAMLVSVVENGFGKAARIPGYYIAGKTGTAQMSFSALGLDKKGYSEKTWQTFVGFGPAFNPQFLILIKLDNPKTKTAEYSAVPIFHDLAEYIINYYQIPPDYESF